MEILALIICIPVIILLLRLLPSKGKVGEMRVASILKKFPMDRYKIINDLLLTSNGYSTQIDHIVISIYGVFVIETKFYQGWIYGGENSEYWTQNIYGNKYQLRNPIHQNQGHIRALKFLLKGYGNIPFISVVAFSRQARLGVDAHTPVIYTGIRFPEQSINSRPESSPKARYRASRTSSSQTTPKIKMPRSSTSPTFVIMNSNEILPSPTAIVRNVAAH